MKTSAALGALAFGGSSLGTETAQALSTRETIDEGSVIYQHFHRPWTEIEADIPRLADVGFDTIWIQQPAQGKLDFEHQSYRGRGGFYGDEESPYGGRDPHPPLGYQPVDLRDFDSFLGTEAELESLIQTAHEHDIDVVVDVVLNHMAVPNAPADPWGGELEWPQFETTEHFTAVPYDNYVDEIRDPQFDRPLLGLPDLDTLHPEVQQIHQQYLRKVADLGADGLRYDAAKHVWPKYWREEINPLADELGLWRVGEILDGNVGELRRFTDTGMSAFDYPLHYAIVEAFEGGSLARLSQNAGAGLVHQAPEVAVTFVQNHDSTGPAVGKNDPEGREVELAEAFILAYAGMPVLYRSGPENRPELEDDDLADLVWVSRNLAHGEVIDRAVDRDVYVFERDGSLLAGINKGDVDAERTVSTSWSDTVLVDHAGDGDDVAVDGSGTVTVDIPAEGYVMYAPDDDDDDDVTREPAVSFDENKYEVESGTTADVDVTVSAGDDDYTDEVTLTVDGTQAAAESVTVEAGESVTVTFEVATDDLEDGTHGLEVAISGDTATSTLVVDDEGNEGDADGITLRVDAPTADGESVYFTGRGDQLTVWRGGIEGTNTGGDTWEVTIDDPGEFEWKTRRGPAGERGYVWERGGNHDHTDLEPSHQGWADE